MMTNNYNIDDMLSDYQRELPSHECAGEECPHRGGFALLVLDSDDSVTVSASSHKLDPQAAVQGFVQAMDSAFLNNAGDLPPAIAIAQGREMIKRAAEEIDLPPEASMNISDTIQQFVQQMREAMQKDAGDDE